MFWWLFTQGRKPMPKENNKLSECHACHHSVSKKAKTCPNCGHRNPAKRPGEVPKPLAWVLIGFTVLTGISMITDPASTNSTYSSVQGFPENQSRQMCIDAITASTNHPSTLKIHRVSGYGTNVSGNGTRRITQTFSAKNAFGLQKTFDAYCEISPEGKLTINVVEQG